MHEYVWEQSGGMIDVEINPWTGLQGEQYITGGRQQGRSCVVGWRPL
jgi:hypothetical protein